VIVLMVAAVIAAGYLHTLPYSFHFDDVTSLRDNAALDRPGDLRALWSFRPSRFVLYLSFAWNAAVTGRTPAGLRIGNLLIHLASSLLVGWIAAELQRRLGEKRGRIIGGRAASPEMVGAIAALIFAAHPLATQAVTYLIQRAASLTAMLELAAVALYLRARRGDGARYWALSWSFALIASFTKEMVVALPILIVAIELALRRAGPRRAPIAALAPYAIVIPIVQWTAHLYNVEERRALSGIVETDTIGHAAYLLTQLTVVPRYLMLWFFPRGQNLDHEIAVHSSWDPAVLAGLLGVVVATAIALVARRRFPLVALGWAWFLIAIAPESSLVPIRDVMYEHRAYLPMAGLAWGAGEMLATFAAGGRSRLLLPGLIVLALVIVTHVRNRAWRDELTLWSDVTRKSPGMARGFNNLGMALEERGQPERAESTYAHAIALEPDYVYARVNLGRYYGVHGRYRDALRVLLEADSLAPDQLEILNNLGTAWWSLGDTTRAAAYFEHALRVRPDAPEPALNLARMRGAETGATAR
jgi:tetratricopeptide (TPR) repeat protein